MAVALAVTAANWVHASQGAREKRALSALTPLNVGQQFDVPLQGATEIPEACSSLFIVDPDCRGCQDLARTVGSDSAKTHRFNIIWVSAAGADATAGFAETYSLPPTRVFAVQAAEYAPPLTLLRRLGIRGVPTRLIVDGQRRIREIRLGGVLPADSSFLALCSPES
jgi:hypothetical protein